MSYTSHIAHKICSQWWKITNYTTRRILNGLLKQCAKIKRFFLISFVGSLIKITSAICKSSSISVSMVVYWMVEWIIDMAIMMTVDFCQIPWVYIILFMGQRVCGVWVTESVKDQSRYTRVSEFCAIFNLMYAQHRL